MLVTFSCSTYANITMFGDVATRLLTLMGHSVTVPGAILAEDVPAALQRLQAALAAEARTPEQSTDADDEDDENDAPVPITRRAVPLIELLQAAAKAESDVMWKQGA